MNEEQNKRVAEFRFSVISSLVGFVRLSRGQKEAIIRELCGRQWEIPYSGRSFLSRSTILNWARLYEKGGRRIEALYPDERHDKGSIRAMDEDTASAIINLKKELKDASLPVIIKEAQKRQIFQPDFKASNATIYRLFERHGLNETVEDAIDRRRFEAEFPNDIWQSDCLHGPKAIVDGKLKKTYLFAIIDDHSRLILHAEFYLHERLDSYIDCLIKALQKRGLPRKLYIDNGPAFRSHQLGFACASLGIAIIHSKPYQPEGRGKIERWFKTVRMQFLPLIADGIILHELNERLWQWIDKEYHSRVHSSTKEMPLKRYLNNIHLITEAPKELHDYFRKRALRKVDKDRTVSLLGRVYESPVELIGKTATLLYHENDPARVEAFYNNKSYGMLVALNAHINCRVKRQQGITQIIAKQDDSAHADVHYSSGQLFGKGGNDNE
jgi:transposase InsO family protein